ncbi:hypothetical protein ACVMAJ_006861 [Bradyrhizobium sp. USDA 4448]
MFGLFARLAAMAFLPIYTMLQRTHLCSQIAATRAAKLRLCSCQTKLTGSECHDIGAHDAGSNN